MTIVTKSKLQSMLDDPNPHYQARVVGRALMVLLHRQTNAEKISNKTILDNGIGFTGADARLGTKHAKYYSKFQKLDQWAVDLWTKKNDKGYSRIAKYWSQLNEEAIKNQKPAQTELI